MKMGMTLRCRLAWVMISVFFLLPGAIIWGNLPPDSNLILHYQFEGNVLDSSTNGNNGTPYGSPSFETGVLGQALVLDGDNDWIDIDDNVLSDFHDRTICLWAKKNVEHTGYLFATAASAYRVYIKNQIDGDLYGAVSDYLNLGPVSVNVGQWYHIALVIRDTMDGNCTGELYLNGQLAEPSVSLLPRQSGPLVNANIGSYGEGTQEFGSATIDDFRIYDYALEDFEVFGIYANGQQNSFDISATSEIWIRESHPTDTWENDGISVWSSASPDGARRYGLVEFDLSGLSGSTAVGATLQLYSAIHGWSDYDKPIKQTAAVIDCSSGTGLSSLNWNSYFSEKDTGKTALESLGAYDLPPASSDPAQQNAYMDSAASATDLELIQAAIDGDDKFCLVFIADEDSTDYGQTWGDAVAVGLAANLNIEVSTNQAYSPTPYNGAIDITPDVTLTWQPGLGATSHNIYFGTDPNQVNQATDPNTIPGRGNQLLGNETYKPASTLDYDTTYYWRIDEANSFYTVKGAIWRFTTQTGQARNPVPSDLETNVETNIILSWTAGLAATEQNIYFGTDYNEVLNATDPNAEPVGRGTVPLETENYLPDESPLEYGTTYYWRIDGINGAQKWQGDVWRFSTNACPVADLTGDCKVDSADWNEFAFQWLEDTSSWNWSSWCADQDGDDDVDTVDLSIFSSEWLKEGDPSVGVQIIKPWRRIVLDPDYRGAWFVAGDVDGDGEVEIVTAQGNTSDSSHYVNAVGVKNLDGTTLWNWGTPNSSYNYIGYDIACQIYDWDNDGDNEVVILTSEGGQRYMVELNGATGVENRRFPIPPDSTDCITFCNLSGPAYGHPKDIIVKTRYTQIWAYDYNGNYLWDVTNPGGYNTCHQTRPFDLNNDGIDELSLGCTMADKDGNILWITKKDGITIGSHVDCVRLFKPASTLNDVRLALTYCGGNRIAMTDGNGSILWDLTGEHFESIDVGKIRADIPGNQIAVDVPYAACGFDPVYVIDENGNKVSTSYHLESRFHRLADWNGDGLQDVIVAEDQAAYDGFGNQIAFFEMPVPDGVYVPSQGCGESRICYVGDMTGDGVTDVVYTTIPGTVVYIYRNALGQKPAGDVRLGTEINFSFY